MEGVELPWPCGSAWAGACMCHLAILYGRRSQMFIFSQLMAVALEGARQSKLPLIPKLCLLHLIMSKEKLDQCSMA